MWNKRIDEYKYVYPEKVNVFFLLEEIKSNSYKEKFKTKAVLDNYNLIDFFRIVFISLFLGFI